MTRLNLQAKALQQLKRLVKPKQDGSYHFSGFALDLETGEIKDQLAGVPLEANDMYIQVLSILLEHYTVGNQTPRSGKLVKFKDVPGGYAYEAAFNQRAIMPIEQAFGEKPQELIAAAKLLNGVSLDYGDVSAEVPALEGIPLVYILWMANEFPASANILFDESASSFLPTEDLAVLGELTTSRLLQAQQLLTKNR